MNVPVIVKAKRTVIGKIGGILKNVPPEQLAAFVIENLLAETGVRAHDIDEVILGNAIGPGGNIARVSALTAKLPQEVPAVTIDRQCGSGLEAINIACRLIQAGAGDIYLAGGVESSSLAPWKVAKPSSLYDMPTFFSRAKLAPDFIGDPDMGVAAENVAKQYNISREAQDEFALASHRKAIAAQRAQLFTKEVVPVNGRNEDEGPRAKLSLKTLTRMPPLYAVDGTVTAGNTCAINDGAAVALVMSERACRKLGLIPQMKYVNSVTVGVDPNLLGIGPAYAVRCLLQRTKRAISDIDLFECNEAFASQVLASVSMLGIPKERLNIFGGALAFGHPYGASGAILVARLCTALRETKATSCVATLGIGGGLGIATLFERYETND